MTTKQVERYKDKTVEIIYCSSKGTLSKRKVKVLAITDKQLYGYCYLRQETRRFLMDGVLAWQPSNKYPY